MKKAIITGATGAIGVALVNELIKQGVQTLVLVRRGSQREQNIPFHPLVTKRDCSLETLKEVQIEGEYDVFYHFAWAGTTGADRNNASLQLNNVRYTLDALALAKRCGCKVFVGAGSQAEYGRVEGALSENTPVNPETGYGIAKLCAGQLSRLQAKEWGITHIWTRILSVYGLYDNPNSMVSSVTDQLSRGEIPKCTAGEQLWDYCFSEDIAEAFYLLGERGKDGKTYVLGSGSVRLLKEYICDIRDLVAPQSEIAFGAVPYYPNQVMYLKADISEIRRDTGWTAKTSFQEGIKKILRKSEEKQ